MQFLEGNAARKSVFFDGEKCFRQDNGSDRAAIIKGSCANDRHTVWHNNIAAFATIGSQAGIFNDKFSFWRRIAQRVQILQTWDTIFRAFRIRISVFFIPVRRNSGSIFFQWRFNGCIYIRNSGAFGSIERFKRF